MRTLSLLQDTLMCEKLSTAHTIQEKGRSSLPAGLLTGKGLKRLHDRTCTVARREEDLREREKVAETVN